MPCPIWRGGGYALVMLPLLLLCLSWLPCPAMIALPYAAPCGHGRNGLPCHTTSAQTIRTVSHRPQTRFRSGTPATPITYMLGRHPTSKISPMPFLSSRVSSGRNHPLGLLFPQQFSNKKSSWVPGGVWLEPRQAAPARPPPPQINLRKSEVKNRFSPD